MVPLSRVRKRTLRIALFEWPAFAFIILMASPSPSAGQAGAYRAFLPYSPYQVATVGAPLSLGAEDVSLCGAAFVAHAERTMDSTRAAGICDIFRRRARSTD
jgi:hypothetical protein